MTVDLAVDKVVERRKTIFKLLINFKLRSHLQKEQFVQMRSQKFSKQDIIWLYSARG